MTDTATPTTKAQRRLALQRANEVRLARAGLKRRLAAGDLFVPQIILACPQEATRWRLGELLMSQPGWGRQRARKFLERNQLSELKPIGQLTARQQQLVAGQLAEH
jgi:hypothetical protein